MPQGWALHSPPCLPVRRKTGGRETVSRLTTSAFIGCLEEAAHSSYRWNEVIEMNEQTAEQLQNFNTALFLVNAGFRTHPCLHLPAVMKGKLRKAKSPYPDIAWKDVKMSEAQVRTWWGLYPDAVPAVQCINFWVLDVDVPDPTHNRQADGKKALAELEAIYGPLPETFTVRTPTGGYHYYFNIPRDGRKIPTKTGRKTGRLPEGFDVRGDGGYVIAPNVVMPNGKYEIIKNVPIVDAPEWLLDLILDRAPVQAMPDMPPMLEADDFPVEQEPPFIQPTVLPDRRLDKSKPETWIDENGDEHINLDLRPEGDAVRKAVKQTVTKQALKQINLHPETVFQRDKCGRGYICPLCQSGSGRNGTGMSVNPKKRNGETYNTPHLTCWNCGMVSNNTVFDIIGLMNGIDPAQKGNFWQIMDKAAALYGISIEKEVDLAMAAASAALQAQPEQAQAAGTAKTAQQAACQCSPTVEATASAQATAGLAQTAAVETALMEAKRLTKQKKQDEPEIDYTAYFDECHSHLAETDYYRGIDPALLDDYNIGYDPAWKHPGKPTSTPTPRLIIPTSATSYLARDTRPADKIPVGSRNDKLRVGSSSNMFCIEWLTKSPCPIFVTEGELDALSVMTAYKNCTAIGIGSVSNAPLFLQACDKTPPEVPLILAMDNDKAGRDARLVLEAGLKSRGIYYTVFELPKQIDTDGRECKDANEVLLVNRDALAASLEEAACTTLEGLDAFREAKREELRNQCAGRALDAFLQDTRGREAVFYSTGIRDLDYWLDGGLYAGLYIVGAISSLGKTTFALSIADNIAASGQDVLIFSLEMARNELIAKSVSRLTAKISLAGDTFPASTAYAQRTRSILAKDKGTHSADEEAVIQMAFSEYRQIGEHLYISEGMGNIGVKEVREQVQAHTRIMGKPPVVLIDYLQILAPADPRSTDKQNTDKAVLELKRISRDFSTPVFVISSFNRDNYAQSVSMVAFKESGAIEYSSDVLIGMQYNGMDAPADMLEKYDLSPYTGSAARPENVKLLSKFWQEKANRGEEQEIQVKVLKNRNGSRGDLVLKFWPKFNYFEDLPEHEAVQRKREAIERNKKKAEEKEQKRKERELKRQQKEQEEDGAAPAAAEAVATEISIPSLPGTEEVPY